MIEIKGLHKNFDDNQVIKNLDLQINPGEKIVVMGPSGCGKSTLLRILATLENYQQGEILISSQNLESIKPISQAMGMVFQSFNLFENMNVWENLIFSPIKIHKQSKELTYQKAQKLLEQLGLEKQKTQYPKTLSGGQKQRVAIARALMLDSPTLLFDEPTSALDPEMSAEVLQAMQGLSKTNRTIICVTHEVEFAKRFADKVLFLYQGEKVFFGETADFFNQDDERIGKFLAIL